MKITHLFLAGLLVVTATAQSPDFAAEGKAKFVGYGLSIPEAGWDDLADVNLRGKIAVYVKSHANTADGRWAAAKQAGAIGIASMPIMTLLQRVADDSARPTWNAESFFRRVATR